MYESSTKETSGCASNLLAHEDLGHLRRPIVGIYKPSSIMKIPTSIWKWQNKRLSIMKIMVLLWSTSVAKDSNIVPSLFFSHFFLFLGLLFFMAFLFFWAFSFYGLCLLFLFLTWDNALENDDHHTSIYLQLNTRTKYDSIWIPPAVYRDMQWTKSACTKELWTVALPQIRCQLHDHAKQYDNDECVMINGTVESCMAIYLEMAMEMS